MTLKCLLLLPTLLAQSPGSSPVNTGELLKLVGWGAIMLVMMYLIIIRPQRTRQKQLNALMENLKPGDKVVTASGIVGVIIGLKDKTVSIRSADSKFEILKSTISEITEKAGAEAAQS